MSGIYLGVLVGAGLVAMIVLAVAVYVAALLSGAVVRLVFGRNSR